MTVSVGDAFVDIRPNLATFNKEMAGAMAPSKFGKFGKAAGGALAAGVVAAGIGKALYDIGAEFDDAFDKIQTQTGATGDRLGKLKDDFKDVVGSVPAEFDDASTALAGFEQRMDLSHPALRRLTKQVLELSRITETDVQENVESISRLFGDWSVRTGDQNETLDEMFRLTQATGIGFSDLSRLMVQFGSPLRQLGFGFEESAAMFARFEREGVNMQTLLPGLRMALKNIAVPTDDLAAMFKKLGVNTRDPHDALLQIFDLLSKDKISESDQTLLASSVFGGRAWADMKAAIEEGRFEFGDLIQTMKQGKQTIRGTGRDTMDLSENWKLFTNRLKVFLEPAGSAVFQALGKGMAALNRLMKGKGGLANTLSGIGDAFRDFWKQSAVFRGAMKLIWDIAKRAWAGIKDSFRSGFTLIRGMVKVISGVLTLRFDRAWDGVKDIFKGGVGITLGILRTMTAPVREIGERIGNALSGPLGDAWDTIKSVFRGGIKLALKIFHGFASGIRSLVGGIRNAFRRLMEILRTVINFIKNAVNKAVGALGDIKSKIPDITPSIPGLPDIPSPGDVAGALNPFREGGLAAVVPGHDTGDRHTLSLGGLPIAKVSGSEGIFVGNSGMMRTLGAWNSLLPRRREGGAVGVHRSYPGVSGDTDFLPALGAALSAMAKGTGTSIFVNSGWRSIQEQAALYQAYLSGTGNLAAAPNPNAPHVSGRAADINPGREVFGGVAGKYGLAFTVPSESWHIEITGAGGAKGVSAGFQVPKIPKVRIKGGGPMGAIPRGAEEMLRHAGNRYIAKHMPVVGTGLLGNVATGPIQQMAHAMVRQLWGEGQWPPFVSLEMAEAGWDPTAQNPSSGAAGLAQALPPSKYPAGAWPYHGLDSAKLQLQWMMGYIKDRYGTPAAAWGFHQANNWYGSGGDFVARRPQLIGVGDRPERVTITPLGAGRRFKMKITNWREGWAEVEEIADGAVDDLVASQSRTNRQSRSGARGGS